MQGQGLYIPIVDNVILKKMEEDWCMLTSWRTGAKNMDFNEESPVTDWL